MALTPSPTQALLINGVLSSSCSLTLGNNSVNISLSPVAVSTGSTTLSFNCIADAVGAYQVITAASANAPVNPYSLKLGANVIPYSIAVTAIGTLPSAWGINTATLNSSNAANAASNTGASVGVLGNSTPLTGGSGSVNLAITANAAGVVPAGTYSDTVNFILYY